MAIGSEQWHAEQKAQATLDVGHAVEALVHAVDRLLRADGAYYDKVEQNRNRGDKRQAARRALAGAVAS